MNDRSIETKNGPAVGMPGDGAAGDADARHYTVLSQVKSHRVVYLTDDPDYVPPTDGDWYFASRYYGRLPSGMTLRNCWSWRFNGAAFVPAPDETRASKSEALIEHNRQALKRLLNDKIEALRKPYAAQTALGESVRQLKLAEARAYLSAGASTGGETFEFLQGVALARNIPMQSAAELICKRAQQTNEVLLATERVRERFALLIEQAETDAQLAALRAALLRDIYPELSQAFKFNASHTEPRDPDAPLPRHHRVHELARLKARLREVVNSLRARISEDYLGHAEVLKFKAQLARWVLSPSSDRPAGLELLEAGADALGLTLEQAAQRVLAELAASGAVLSRTEKQKDYLLARIERVRTKADIDAIDAELAEIEKADAPPRHTP